jgi:hypothetical protein
LVVDPRATNAGPIVVDSGSLRSLVAVVTDRVRAAAVAVVGSSFGAGVRDDSPLPAAFIPATSAAEQAGILWDREPGLDARGEEGTVTPASEEDTSSENEEGSLFPVTAIASASVGAASGTDVSFELNGAAEESSREEEAAVPTVAAEVPGGEVLEEATAPLIELEPEAAGLLAGFLPFDPAALDAALELARRQMQGSKRRWALSGGDQIPNVLWLPDAVGPSPGEGS